MLPNKRTVCFTNRKDCNDGLLHRQVVLTIFLIIKNIYPLPNSIRVLLGKGYIFFSLWEKIYNVMRMEPVVYFKFLVFIYHTLILSNMKNSLVLSSSLAIVCLLWPIMFDIHLQKFLYNYKERKEVFNYKLFVNIICNRYCSRLLKTWLCNEVYLFSGNCMTW